MSDTSLRPFITGIRLTFFKEFSAHVILWLPMEGNTEKIIKLSLVTYYFVDCLSSHFSGNMKMTCGELL